MGSGAGRESSTYGEAAVNEWTPVSCSARKFQSGHNGAARASEGSSAGAACQSSLTPPRRTAPREKRRVHSLYPPKNRTERKCALFHFFVCFLVPNLTTADAHTAKLSAHECAHMLSRTRPPIYLPALSNRARRICWGGTRPRHRQSRAQVQTQKKTCTPTQITAQSQTNLFLPPTCPRALP